MPHASPSPPTPGSSALTTVPHEEGLVIIGKGTRVQGRIGDCRKLDVQGILEADVVADMLLVREGGGLKGTVKSDHAEIHGVFEGTLVVHDHLDIQSTGQVTGEISYRTLAIQTGGKMRGNIVCHEPDSELELGRAPETTADVISINGHHAGTNGYAHDEPVPSPFSTPVS